MDDSQCGGDYWCRSWVITREMDVVGEVLHEGDKVRPGCYVYATVYLEVEEVGPLECMVLVA